MPQFTEALKVSDEQVDHVLICEHSKAIKAKFCEVLDGLTDVQVVQVCTITHALESLAKYKPHLIVIGNSIEGDSTTDLLRSIKESPLSINVPVLALPQGGLQLEDGVTEFLDLLESPESIQSKVENLLESSRYFFQASQNNDWLEEMEVLVAEDSKSYMHVYKSTLSRLGIKARTFVNGKLAWDYLATCSALPSLVITDIVMPEMTGMELVRRIRAERRFDNVPVIASSTISELNQLNAIFELGANDYFPKPIEFDVFVLRLKAHLKTHKLMHEQQKLQEELSDSNQVLNKTLKELQSTQLKLVESEKMAALGGLVTGIAHEINTPLGIGITCTSQIEELIDSLMTSKKDGQLTESMFIDFVIESKEAIDLTKISLQRGAKLIKDFKMVAVTQSGNCIVKFDMKSCLLDALTILESEFVSRKFIINLECPESPMIEGYREAYQKIISNLVSNSILHGFSTVTEGKIDIKVASHNGELCIYYTDDGAGMSEQNLSKLFEPFFTTKRSEGMVGLGSHIIYNLVVQKLHGTIHCKSELGQGCKYQMKFPIKIVT